jgi:hypothetical protein
MTTETYVNDSAGRPTIIKDPDAVLDYSFDWTAYLALISDAISTSTFTASSGNINSTSVNGAVTTAWVSGGAVGEKIMLTNRITTTGGRTDDRSVFIKIKDR